jgi:hypothetical protein
MAAAHVSLRLDSGIHYFTFLTDTYWATNSTTTGGEDRLQRLAFELSNCIAPMLRLKLAARRAPHSTRISILNVSATLGCLGPRFYAQGPSSRPPAPKKTTPPVFRPTSADGRQVHHEVHEGTVAINIPYNPPGGGAGPGLGGSGSVFPLTNSPLLDAALTTIIGLGMGESSLDSVA